MATILLCVIYGAFIALGIPDSLFGAAWPAIYPDLGVSVGVASFYSMLSSLGTVISSLFSDRVIRRFGTERVAAFSTALTAAGLLIFSFGQNIWVLCLCALPLGLGGGAVDTALNNYVALHYNARQMSFLHCFYGVGVALSPYLLSFALEGTNNWRGGYRMMFAIQLAIALVLILTLPLWKRVEKRQEALPVEVRTVSKKQILKNPVARVSLLIFAGSCALESMCLAWGSTWLVNTKGMAPANGAQIITIYYIGMTLGRFLSGVVGNLLRPKQILLLGEGICFAGVAALFLPGVWPAAVGLFAIGLGNGPVFPNMTYLTPIHFGKDVCQSFIGLQMASASLAFMITPLIFGQLTRVAGVGLFSIVCLLTFCLAAVATVLLCRRTGDKE